MRKMFFVNLRTCSCISHSGQLLRALLLVTKEIRRKSSVTLLKLVRSFRPEEQKFTQGPIKCKDVKESKRKLGSVNDMALLVSPIKNAKAILCPENACLNQI